MMKLSSASALILTSVLFSVNSFSATITYTNQAAFLAALPGPANTLDFDSLSAGTTIANGDTVDGISFHYDFEGVQMQVSNVFDTTSSPNFLGTNSADILQDGDNFDLSFAPVKALGMFFITADEMFDNDITLSTGLTSVGLSVSDAGAALGDGGIPYFLGIIDDTDPFITASITTIGGGFFLYNVDDIVTAVPLPGALWLFGSGLIGLLAIHRRN